MWHILCLVCYMFYIQCVDSFFVIKEVESCVFIFAYSACLCVPNHGSVKEHFVSIKFVVQYLITHWNAESLFWEALANTETEILHKLKIIVIEVVLPPYSF
jgi:hypothetical protein